MTTAAWLTGTAQTRMLASLDESVDNGTLLSALANAIRTTGDDGYDTIPYSMGFKWLQTGTNTATFLHTVGDVEEYFRGLFDCNDVAQVIHYKDIMAHIPAGRRLPFVRDLILKSGAFNTLWVESLLEIGITKHDIGEIIIARLQDCTIRPDNRNHSFILGDFLSKSIGDVRETTDSALWLNPNDRWVGASLWNMLDDEQFRRAVDICIERVPLLLLEHGYHRYSVRRLLTIRLSEDIVNKLVDEAVNKLLDETNTEANSLKGLSIDELMRLPAATRMLLMGAVPAEVPIDLLIRTALELPPANGIELCQLFHPVLQGAAPSFTYRRFWQQLEDAKATNPAMAEWILKEFTKRLEDNGFILAQVTEQVRRNKRSLVVIDPSTKRTYVRDMYQREYSPKVGDWVIVDTKRPLKEFIKNKVYLVHFMPAHTDGKYA